MRTSIYIRLFEINLRKNYWEIITANSINSNQPMSHCTLSITKFNQKNKSYTTKFIKIQSHKSAPNLSYFKKLKIITYIRAFFVHEYIYRERKRERERERENLMDWWVHRIGANRTFEQFVDACGYIVARL